MAAGPFDVFSIAKEGGKGGSSDYQPLQDILVQALDNKPDLLILCGPFVDSTQPHVRSGAVSVQVEKRGGEVEEQTATFDSLFAEKVVREGIEALFNSDTSIPTQVVLVPSLLDAFHTSLFPQVYLKIHHSSFCF